MRTTPSMVAFTEDGETLVGMPAKRQARDQPREHHLRGQAPDRAPVRRSGRAQGHRHGAVQDRARRQRRRLGRGARREEGAVPDQRRRAQEDEGDRRAPSRRDGDQGGDHGAGVLQRLPAPGDQGRRPDRRPRGAAHHQRADRGGARLRPGEVQGADDRGLRPRRRHVRHLDPRDRRRRVRGQGDQRRHLPRRRGLRQAPDRLHGGRVQEGAGDRPARRPSRAAAAQGGGREGQDRALEHDADRDQPAVHHRRPERAQAPDHEDQPGQARDAGRRSDRPHGGAVPQGAEGRRPVAGGHRRGDPGRRP